MSVPTWVREALQANGEPTDVLECQVLKEGAFRKLAFVSTGEGHRVVEQGMFNKEAFRIQVLQPSGPSTGLTVSDGLTAAEETAAPTPVEQAPDPVEPAPEPVAESPEEPATIGEATGDPVLEIEGIGPTYNERLEEAGITLTGQLAEADIDHIAEVAEVSPTVAGRWVSMAQLVTLDGIGPQYAELLVRSGISSPAELAEADAGHLLEVVREIEEERDVRIQGNVIGPKRVLNWIRAAGGEPEDIESLTQQPAETTEITEATEAGPELVRVNGIGSKRAEILHEHGIETIAAFLEADSEALAENLGVSVDQVEAWKTSSDLTSIDGIGPKRAGLLQEHGIVTLAEFVQADSQTLAEGLDVTVDQVDRFKRVAVETAADLTDLTALSGVGPARATELISHGITTQADLSSADPATVAQALSVSESRVVAWQETARNGN